MKTSIYSWFGYFEPVEKRLDVIAEAGFDEVMLSWEDETAPVHVPKEAFPDMVRSRGMAITNFHAPYIGYSTIWEKSPAENRALLKELTDFTADCRRFDVPALVVHTNDLDLGPYQLENGLAFFSELAEAGEKYGVDIAVENVSRQFLLTYLLDRIKTPHFGMCYDSSHDYMLNCGRGRILENYGHRIKALHLSDNDLNLDRHWIPGQGRIPFERLIPCLLEKGVTTLSFEVNANKAWRQRPSLDFARAVHRSLEPFLPDVGEIPVGAAVLTDDDGRILICRRNSDDSCGGLWEFPGGKIESGETAEDCAVRECEEELGIAIGGLSPLDEARHVYPDRQVHLTFLKGRILQGIPKKRVHSDIRWVYPKELAEYHFCPADKKLILKLAEWS